jgi:catechol 2,3-dioxygenase-like lactoylglutathione lyase family enzyme
MTRILNVAEAVLYVDDLPAAVAFYRDVLGLPVSASFADAAFLQAGPDSTVILFDRAGLARRKSQIPHHGAEGPGHVALAVAGADMDTWREKLLASGVNIEHEQDWPQGTHSIYFRDPAGNSVELIEDDHYPRVWRQMKRQ